MKLALISALTIGFLASSVLSEVGQKVRYDNCKVYRFVPHTEAEREVLLQLQSNNPGVGF
jgi:hypothetical protein